MNAFNRVSENDARPLLVLDIDQTLLFAATSPLTQPCDYRAERTWIYKRPYVDAFLHFCMLHFQIAVWTSARASYAEEIFSQVFNYLSLIFIHSERHCLEKKDINGQLVSLKPLQKTCKYGFTLNRVLVIDDSKEKHSLNPDNLILISPYNALVEDNELRLLKNYLNTIKHQTNFLNINKQNWHQTSNCQVS